MSWEMGPTTTATSRYEWGTSARSGPLPPVAPTTWRSRTTARCGPGVIIPVAERARSLARSAASWATMRSPEAVRRCRWLALKDDGTVWTWGFNQSGQLGNGTYTLGTPTVGVNTPAQVGELSAVKAIAGGGEYSLAGR